MRPADEVFRQAHNAYSDDERARYDAAGAEVELAFRTAELVYAARTKAGLTQSELAQRLGMSQSAISVLEGGGRVPTLATLARIAQATGRHLEFDLPEAG